MGGYLVTLIILLSALWVGFLIATRKILFAFPGEEDSATMIKTAARSNQWRWPSDMHDSEHRATYMKDMHILLLVIFQKLFRDKISIRPLVAMQGFTNIVSALFIFLIASNYWGITIGFFISILFIVSFWPWQTATIMGHINVATMFFLIAVYSASKVSGLFTTILDIQLILAGIFFCFMLFSSSSSFKYMPLFFTALFFSRFRLFFENNDLVGVYSYVINYFNNNLLINVWIPILIIILFITIKLLTKKIVTILYYQESPKLSGFLLKKLGRKMSGRNDFSFDHYLEYARWKINNWLYWILTFYFSFALLVDFIGFRYLAPIAIGLTIAFLFLTLPNPKRTFGYYLFYVNENMLRQKNTFRHWIKYFAKKGISVWRRTKGGWPWIIRAIPRFIPFQVILACSIIAFLLAHTIIIRDLSGLILIISIFIISLSPIIWANYTNASNSVRSYAPAFSGILLLLGYGLNKLQLSSNTLMFYLLPFSIVVFLWNLWIFITDICPSRMTISKLLEVLEKYKIKEFYTYKTDFNIILLNTVPPKILEKFKISYIESLDQINDGWVVIPATCYKTCMYVSTAMELDTETTGDPKDFRDDPALNRLLETRRLEKIATEKFKTFGSSRFWIHDHEITTYLDLLLHDITPADRFRSYAWLINAKDIH